MVLCFLWGWGYLGVRVVGRNFGGEVGAFSDEEHAVLFSRGVAFSVGGPDG